MTAHACRSEFVERAISTAAADHLDVWGSYAQGIGVNSGSSADFTRSNECASRTSPACEAVLPGHPSWTQTLFTTELGPAVRNEASGGVEIWS